MKEQCGQVLLYKDGACEGLNLKTGMPLRRSLLGAKKHVFRPPKQVSTRDEGRGDTGEKYLGGKTVKTWQVTGFSQDDKWGRDLSGNSSVRRM